MVAQSPKQSNAMCRTVHISSLKVNSSLKSMKEQQSIVRMWSELQQHITRAGDSRQSAGVFQP